MVSKAFVFLALFLVSSVLAEEKSQQEANQAAQTDIKVNEMKTAADKEVNTYFGGGCGGCQGGGQGGWGQGGGGSQVGGQGAGGGQVAGGGQGGAQGGGGGGRGWSEGWSHGGIYGSGQHCHFGCCSKSFGASAGGGYMACKCCFNAAEAKAYKESLPQTNN